MGEIASPGERMGEGEVALARGAWHEAWAIFEQELGARETVEALEGLSGHPYLRLPLQFAAALEERLLSLVSAEDLEQLREQGEAELQEPRRWGTTFTLLQCWGRWP
jgi:hypothetical protein